MKIAAVALLWLLGSSSVAHAAPGLNRGSRLICDVQAQARALRKLLRHPKSYGGPLATRPQRDRLAVRLDLTDHMRRAKRTANGHDAAAIQNDAPAARVAAEDQAPPSLESLGFLTGPVDSHPRTRACSPPSPRGPPAAV
jgi:hypothetical protein